MQLIADATEYTVAVSLTIPDSVMPTTSPVVEVQVAVVLLRVVETLVSVTGATHPPPSPPDPASPFCPLSLDGAPPIPPEQLLFSSVPRQIIGYDPGV